MISNLFADVANADKLRSAIRRRLCWTCGGPLGGVGTYEHGGWVPYAQGNRRQYCADLCRVYAMRARRRMAGERER